jgi:hypothetical protein
MEISLKHSIYGIADADEEVSVMEVPCVMFREYRWRIGIIKKERGDRGFDGGMLG